MQTSLLIARILGPCFLVVATGIMFNLQFYQRVMEDYCRNAAMIFFGGMFALVIGIVVLLFHNAWAANWTVIITIYGWGGVIKGAWLIIFPNSVAGFTQAYVKNKILLVVHAVIVVIFGVVLTVLGYFVS